MNNAKKIGLDIINNISNDLPETDIYFKTNNDSVEISFMNKGKFYSKVIDKLLVVDYDINSITEEIKKNLGVE